MRVARLNTAGIDCFASWLDKLKIDPAIESPDSLLSDPAHIDVLDQEIDVEIRCFVSRFDAAEYFFNKFATAGLDNVETDRGLWTWLSLFYINAVCPADSSGERKPRESARYILDPTNYQRYYRHLLAGPYRIYRAYHDDPKIALSFLCQPLSKFGDVVEQLASRQELVTNRGVVSLVTKLYVDHMTGKLKRGAGGKSAGSPRRLSDILDQFDLTWDLYTATSDELLKVLPREFNKFKDRA